MSNRIHSSRLDFRSGWVMHQQRYGVPGAPSEMSNVQLDLLAEGALRPTWGMVPFAFTGSAYSYVNTQSQFINNDPGPRYPGISAIEVLKVGDSGAEDTIMVAQDYYASSSTFTTVFYHVDAATNSNKVMNFPFDTGPFTAAITSGHTLTYHISDFCYLFGMEDPKSTVSKKVPITVTKNSGSCNFTNSENQFTLRAYGAGTSLTPGAYSHEIIFTHDDTSVVETLTFVVNVSNDGLEPSDYYHIFTPGELDWTTPNSTATVYESFAFESPSRSDLNIAFFHNNPTTTGMAAYMDYTQQTTFTYDKPEWTLTSAPQAYWEYYGTGSVYTCQQGYQAGPSAPITLIDTGSHYLYWPVNAPISDTNSAEAWSTSLIPVNTVTGITKSDEGPYGIWKVASMNGKAFWFCGYSGTAFWVDLDDPTSTGTIGLTSPDCSGVTLAAYSDPQSKPRDQYPRRLVRYWLAEIDEEGNESAICTDKLTFDNKDFDDNGVRLSNIPAASNTQSYFRIYRSVSKLPNPNAGEPLMLGDTEPQNPVATVSFDDRVPDDELGDPPWTHGDVPPYDAFCPVVYYDRLWVLGTRPGVTGAERTTLFWSDINSPESFWWDGNWANVYGDDGDLVTAMVRAREGLLIFKNNHLYLMAGRTPEEISFNEITVEDSDTGVGTPHPNSVVATDHGVFFYWNRGIYRYHQGVAQKISRAISPLLEGYEELLPTDVDIQWPYYGLPDDTSVVLSYDPITQVVQIGMDGLFPNIENMPNDVYAMAYPTTEYRPVSGLNSPGRTDEVTLLLDAANARWIGMYTFRFGFFRRVRLKLYDKWTSTYAPIKSNVGSALIGAYLGTNEAFLGFGNRHPLMVTQGTALMNSVPLWHTVKFRPVSGNLGPYSSKRFIGVDYLMDEDGAVWNSAASSIASSVFLDGNSAADSTSTLTVQGGQIYSERLRHTLGLVGSELEAKLAFDPLMLGGVVRLFEYGVAWQNMGREIAERPGAAPTSPKGGPALTGPPVTLR